MHKIRIVCVSEELDRRFLSRLVKQNILRIFFALLCFFVLPAPTAARERAPDKDTCGLISRSSTLPGVSLVILSNKCSFSQAEMRKGIRIDYELMIDREIHDVVALPQDMTGCQKPGPSGLITFRVIRGGGYSFCPQCDLGPCRKPPAREAITLKPGRYAENIQWNGRNFTGNGEGMSTIQPIEFPPGSYILDITARGRIQESERSAASSPSEFTIALEYRITITPTRKEEQPINSGGGSL